MDEDPQSPSSWHELCFRALRKPDAGLIAEARIVVFARLEEIGQRPEHRHEKRALELAIRKLDMAQRTLDIRTMLEGASESDKPLTE